MVIAFILFIGAASLTTLEIIATRKRKQINAGISFVLGKERVFANRESYLDSAVVGAGTSALNMYDIYAACEDHSAVLDVLEGRYNHVMGDATPMEWYEKVEQLKYAGTSSLGAYVSGYAGQAGENAAISMFESTGKKAELFESRIHPDNDIRVFDDDGSFTDYSVKSYSDASNFKEVLQGHPESTNYVINHELYEELAESGDLDAISSQGIEILDGGFSNEVARNAAEDAFDGISDAGDISNNIPVVALALFGAKTVKNVVQLTKGKQSGYETTVNIGGDFARIGAAGLCAAGCGKIGALIGTAVNPGVGTIVGSDIGVIVGAIAGSSLVNFAKERIKWGKIIDAIDILGKYYEEGVFRLESAAQSYLYGISDIRNCLSDERKLNDRYSAELNSYSTRKPSLPALLTHIHCKSLNAQIDRIIRAASNFCSEIDNLCSSAALKRADGKEGKARKIKRRLIGELIASNSATLLGGTPVEPELATMLDGYNQQISKSPHHPYRFQHDSKDIVNGLAVKSLRDTQYKMLVSVPVTNPLMIGLILLLVGIACYLLWGKTL